MQGFYKCNKKKLIIYFMGILAFAVILIGRIFYIMIVNSDYYIAKAQVLHERERTIKAARGEIVDRNGNIIATNKTVCTISVIHSQITNPEKVIEVLCNKLSLKEETVRKKVEKISSREKIATNVSKETGDEIRELDLDGVKVDEDYKRYYPYAALASKVLGFTGSDNQGIIGIEVKYEDILKGRDGLILTETDSRGIELKNVAESRLEPVNGNTLKTTLDLNIQLYASQLAREVLEAKQANYVSIIVMNPQNGEIYAMVNEPEFNLNEPYTLNYVYDGELNQKEKQDLLNKMWRNQCINDTYEPGSTFKIVTATAGLELGLVTPSSNFSCPGFRIVEDRRIRCHKVSGHGGETFIKAIQNSCNPVFIDVGLKVGVNNFYKYMEKLGFMKKTGIDLPGEAGIILHKIEDVGLVELATMSFGQSFQITPISLLRAASAIVNGGKLVTPHFALSAADAEGNIIKEFSFNAEENVIEEATSNTMKILLESVVSEGGGKNAIINGYSIGGKTATSQKLPRSAGKYISSFIGFAPAQNPEIIAICIIDEPKGIYYGGTIAAPVIRKLYENILPYMEIEKTQETENLENGKGN